MEDEPRPLPDEMAGMDQEETVCSVCGVSYLVFREIKALEKRIRTIEADSREKDESVKAAKEALEAALRSKSDADGIIANINQRCEQKLKALQDQHEGAIRLACAEAEAAQRTLLSAAEKRATDEKQRREEMAATAMQVVKAYRSLKKEFELMKSNTSSLLKASFRDTSETASKALGAVQSLDSKVLESSIAITGLQNQLDKADEQSRQTKGEVAELAAKLDESSAKAAQLSTQLEDCTRELAEMQQRAADSEAAANEKGLALTFATSELEQMQQKHREKLASTLEEAEKALEALTEQEKRTKQVENSLEQEKLDKEGGLKKLAAAEQQVSSLSKDQQRLSQEVQRLRTEVNEKGEQLLRNKREAASEYDGVQQALTKARDEIVHHESAKLRLESKVKDLERSVESLTTDLSSSRAQGSSSNLKLTEHIEKLKAEVLHLEKQAQRAKGVEDDLKGAREQSRQLEQQLHALQSEHATQTQQLEAKNAALDNLSREFKELSSQLTRTSDVHAKQMHSRDQAISDLGAKLAEAEAALKDAEEKAAESQGEEHWKAKMSEFEGLVGRLAGNLRSKESTIQTLQGTVQRECEERHELQRKMNALEEQLRQAKPISRRSSGSTSNQGHQNWNQPELKLPHIHNSGKAA